MALELNPQNSIAIQKVKSKKELKDIQDQQRDKRLFGKTEKEIALQERKSSLYSISKLEPQKNLQSYNETIDLKLKRN